MKEVGGMPTYHTSLLPHFKQKCDCGSYMRKIKCKENIEMVIKVYSCILSSSNLLPHTQKTFLPLIPSHFLFAFENHLKCKSYSNILQKKFFLFHIFNFSFSTSTIFYSFSRSFAFFFSL